jgi:peptidoglycan/LPS O-acetylase OafA/YrhL
MWLAFAASLPPVLLLMATGQFYTPWSWLPRIVMQFTAGALACAAVRKLRLSDATRRGAGYLSVLLAGGIVGMLYVLDVYPLATIRDASGLVDVLFVPLVVTLAVGIGTLPRLLSTRVMVYCGHISFALYMVHELVHTAWNWTVAQFELTLTPDLTGKAVLVGLLAVAVGGAVVLYHFVEEPARRWMRRMVDAGDSRTDSRIDSPAEPVHGKLQPIHGPREVPTETVSARAG